MAAPLPAAAQNIEWIGTVPLVEEAREGFELRLRTDRADDKLGQAGVMRGICNHFLPAAVPLVRERTVVTKPEFVALTIVTRSWEMVLGAGGRWQATYDIEDLSCGREQSASARWSGDPMFLTR
ncbi:hypothetical protein OCH239_04565 [Roseivivax halodurans JCM 10272]|uniref:Uncharacterized protein n=2 Tax=Roseivivax halodurans TaxID=93683 RepID=X7EE18_9RHOB|nr:hypothetical protein OCH239_04565 [Roseivivax halodurans JCM 10272]